MSARYEYDLIDAVNWSTLKYLRESAAHYQQALLTPQQDTMPLMLGRALHTLVLEPDTFEDSYAIYTGGDRRGKDWLDFAERNAGKTIFKPSEIDDVINMAAAVRSSPDAQPYLNEGAEFEQQLRWIDQRSGLKCKGRTDIVHRGLGVLADLKSARSTEARRFGAEAARFAYPQQLAHYANGVKAALGWTPRQHLLIAVEKTPPYDVAVFEIDPDARDIADTEVSDLLLRLAGHRAAGEWPGRYSGVQALQLPAYVYQDDDEDDADGYGLSLGG